MLKNESLDIFTKYHAIFRAIKNSWNVELSRILISKFTLLIFVETTKLNILYTIIYALWYSVILSVLMEWSKPASENLADTPVRIASLHFIQPGTFFTWLTVVTERYLTTHAEYNL